MLEERVKVTVRFITIMQKYTGRRREIEMDLSPEPEQAIEHIIQKFDIPWTEQMQKFIRIFINRELSKVFVENGKQLKDGDTILFVPVSCGG